MPPRSSKETKPKTSTARRRAEQEASGGDFSCYTVPDGVSMWKPKAGLQKVDIVGYTVGEGNLHFKPGEFHYELTFYMHARVGGEGGRSYLCPRMMRNRKCPICEEQALMCQEPDVDEKARKSLLPKKRQLFLVYDHADKEKGIQLWDFSFHMFGKLLNSRIMHSDDDDGFEFFYYPDTDGMTLKLTFEEETNPFGKHLEVKSVDFVRRKESLPDEIANHGICLESILKVPSYDDLRAVFLQIENTGDEPPAKASKAKPKAKPEPEDDEDDEPPAKTSKAKASNTVDDDAKWLRKQAKLAIGDDEEAQQALSDRAEAVGLDVEDFESWSDVAGAIIAAEVKEEAGDDDDDPPVKASAKKAKPKAEPEDDDWEDDEDEPPAKASKAKPKAKPEPEDGDEDEDDDAPAPKSKATTSTKSKTTGSRSKTSDDDDDWDDDWEDDEDDEPAPKSKAPAKSSGSAKPARK